LERVDKDRLRDCQIGNLEAKCAVQDRHDGVSRIR
jgi:hypothetical protein